MRTRLECHPHRKPRGRIRARYRRHRPTRLPHPIRGHGATHATPADLRYRRRGSRSAAPAHHRRGRAPARRRHDAIPLQLDPGRGRRPLRLHLYTSQQTAAAAQSQLVSALTASCPGQYTAGIETTGPDQRDVVIQKPGGSFELGCEPDGIDGRFYVVVASGPGGTGPLARSASPSWRWPWRSWERRACERDGAGRRRDRVSQPAGAGSGVHPGVDGAPSQVG